VVASARIDAGVILRFESDLYGSAWGETFQFGRPEMSIAHLDAARRINREGLDVDCRGDDETVVLGHRFSREGKARQTLISEQ
jgi:hypothetical protein